ncbi:PH domain-containing protein [Miniimonas arenae]|uniref:PH domain-containing protein n=1 Tax=Miniimonas arenae TaxID=676201 RepID=UPI001C589CC5|nr:PH domain-containing protein [Miniimonas arenae]
MSQGDPGGAGVASGAGGAASAGAASSDGVGPTTQWRRVHRVTPLLTAWKMAAALVAIALFQSFDDLARIPLPVLAVIGLVAGVILLAILVSLGYSYLAWRRMEYAITSEAVVLRSGVLFRRERVARLTRIQAVEVGQPILGRIFGFAAVKVESAGGADAVLSLAYLTQDEAQAVRNEVLARAAGVDVDDLDLAAIDAGQDSVADVVRASESADAAASVGGPDAEDGVVNRPGAPGASGAPGAGRDGAVGPDGRPDASTGLDATTPRPLPAGLARRLAPEAPEHQVFQLAPGRLVGSLLLHGATVVLLLWIVGVVGFGVFTGSWEALFGSIFALLGVVGFVWGRFSSEFNTRVAVSPDGLRVRAGLLETKAKTIPPGRVQAVAVHQGPLWRLAGWWRLRVTLANVGIGSDGDALTDALLPVGTREEVAVMLRLVLPDLHAEEYDAVVAGLVGSGDAEGWVPAPRRARWVDPLAWRRNAFRVLGAALALRRGRIWRELTFVPHERTQSLGVSQGPIDRRLRVVTFSAHTSGGISPTLPHVDAAVAAALMADQAERARAARRVAGPEQWMRHAEP